MVLVDTHAHIHDPKFKFDAEAVLEAAHKSDVKQIICVGTDAQDSVNAVDFATAHSQCYATVGLHPHDAKLGAPAFKALENLVDSPKVVAVGECGLDYFYQHSPKPQQLQALKRQIELALMHQKPLVFHVREAFNDFFKVIKDYPKIEGVIHSFSSSAENLNRALERGLYVAFNGIMTFTKDRSQLAAAMAAPLERMLLETDSPFLTPAPYRGKPNQPANVKQVAEFLAELRGEDIKQLANTTSANAQQLFKLPNSEGQ